MRVCFCFHITLKVLCLTCVALTGLCLHWRRDEYYRRGCCHCNAERALAVTALCLGEVMYVTGAGCCLGNAELALAVTVPRLSVVMYVTGAGCCLGNAELAMAVTGRCDVCDRRGLLPRQR
jgi:hypothetical protein